MNEPDPWELLPPELVAPLQRELLGVADVGAFWVRSEALVDLLPRRASPPGQVVTRRIRAESVLPPLLWARVRDVLDDPDAQAYRIALDAVVDHWRALRLDQEKMLGHLLIVHRQDARELIPAGYDELASRHAAMHIDATTTPTPPAPPL